MDEEPFDEKPSAKPVDPLGLADLITRCYFAKNATHERLVVSEVGGTRKIRS